MLPAGSATALRRNCRIEAVEAQSGSEITYDWVLLECGAGDLVDASARHGGENAKKGNHWSRRMGRHGSVGDGAGCTGAASPETPAAHAYGRNQKAFGGRFAA